jgi:hypothetical protein
MYAKLVFNTNTTVAAKIRDITRIIHDSNSGNANLSNLESINVSESELIAGINSGWQTVGKSLPASGTAFSLDDAFYYLEGSCVDSSKKKYVSIHANSSFTTSTLIFSGSGAPTSGVVLSCVIDYGTATEIFTEGYSSTNANIVPYYGLGSSYNSEIVYIFATPRSLILVGSGGVTQSNPMLHAHLEFIENASTKKYSLSPIAKIVSLPQQGATGTPGFWRGGNIYGGTGDMGSQFYFPKSIFSYYPNPSVQRLLTFYDRNQSAQTAYYYSTVDNGTTTGVATMNGAEASYFGGGDFISFGKFDHSFYSPRYGFGNSSASTTTYSTEGEEIDENGNLRIPIIPLVCDITFTGSGLIDFSLCKIYKTVGTLGINGDELILGSDSYYYFTGTGTNTSSALLIKKE